MGGVLTAWCSRLCSGISRRVSASPRHNPALSPPTPPRPGSCACIIVGPPCWSLVLVLFLFPGLSQRVQLSLHGTHAEPETALCPTGSRAFLSPGASPRPLWRVLAVLCGPGAPHAAPLPGPSLCCRRERCCHGHPACHSVLTSEVHRRVESPRPAQGAPSGGPHCPRSQVLDLSTGSPETLSVVSSEPSQCPGAVDTE